MSKKSSVAAVVSTPVEVVEAPVVTPSPLQEKLNEQDKNTLDVAKLQRQMASLEAEKALAKNESADASFKYLILQLYVKYGLNPQADAIDEQGNIMRGALLNRQGQ